MPLPAPPFTLGELDLTAPAVQAWLRDEQARKQALDILDRPLILLGAGSVMAQEFVTSLTARGRVIALVDNARAGETRDGIPYIGDGELAARLASEPRAIGILCCASENAIAHFTRAWGVTHPLLGYFDVLGLCAGEIDAGRQLDFLPGFAVPDLVADLHRQAVLVFTDPASRRTLDALMLYRLTWDGRFLAPVARPEKAIYFEPEVMPLGDDEILVDGGAYDGDTVRDFQARTGGRYGHIHAFEIDPVNADAFAHKTAGIPRVSLHRVGLWNEPAEMGIEQRERSNGSRVNDTGTLTVPLDAMDNMDLGRASIVKLDIEGAEVQALNGARRLIETHRPKLAICAYHKADDLSTIVGTLKGIRTDYRLSLRHYSPVLFDTVIFAT